MTLFPKGCQILSPRAREKTVSSFRRFLRKLPILSPRAREKTATCRGKGRPVNRNNQNQTAGSTRDPRDVAERQQRIVAAVADYFARRVRRQAQPGAAKDTDRLFKE